MMKRSRILSFGLAAALAVVACVSSFAGAVHDFALTAYRHGREMALKVFAGPVEIEQAQTPTSPRVQILRAESFVQRLLKRSRPVVTPGWRECPSI